MVLILPVLLISVLCAAAFLLWRYPVAVAVSAVAGAMLADVLEIGKSGFQLGGISIYPFDLSCVALIACCIVVGLRTRSLPQDVCWPALLLLGLGFLNFGRGALTYGLKASGNDARQFINLVLPVVAFSCLSGVIRMSVERLVTFLSVISLALALVSAARWAGVLAMPDVFDEEFRTVTRVLPSDYAIVIGQALIGVVGIQLMRGIRTTSLIFAGVFAALVFALQHRSVWTATAAGLAWLALRSPRLARREWLQFSSLILLVAAAVSLTPLIASGPLEKVEKLFHSNVEEVSQDDSTWAWRVEGYLEASQRVFSNGLTESVIGPPSGRDLSSTVKTIASIYIHDRYVDTLANYGVLGLTILLAWLLSAAARIARLAPRDPQTRMDKAILEAMLVSMVFYFVPYSGGQLQGTLLGAMWLASAAGLATGSDISRTPLRTAAPDYELLLQLNRHRLGERATNISGAELG